MSIRTRQRNPSSPVAGAEPPDPYHPRPTAGLDVHITQEKKEEEMKALLEEPLPMFARVRTWWRLLLVTLQEKHEW